MFEDTEEAVIVFDNECFDETIFAEMDEDILWNIE